jgi:transcriptional regulator
MYMPRAFSVTDQQILHQFIDQHSFATLVSTLDGKPFASHLPLLLERTRSAQGALLGHVARANPHWRAFDGKQEALAIFQGPHAYVSPSWYSTAPAVPTWNYTAVHAYGVPQVLADEQAFSELLDRLIAYHEAGMPTPWSGELPADFRARLMQGIVGFVMPIERLEGKFKLSQNRSQEDRRRVVEHLAGSADAGEKALAELSKHHLGCAEQASDSTHGTQAARQTRGA